MQVDDSFTQYVVLRWSALFRLATLLAGPDRADEVTRSALARAYASWRDVQESPSVDLALTQLLAGAAVRGAASPAQELDGPAASLPERSRLWAAIEALPARERAMLVLRHHERLADAEIAHALRLSTAAVSSEVRALETGLDLAALREELSVRSDAVRPPPPSVDALLVAGRSERRWRRARTLRWTAAVVVVVAPLLLLTSWLVDRGGSAGTVDPAPATPRVRFVDQLPDGSPPQIAYALGRSLYLASGAVVALDDTPTSIVQTRTWMFVSYLSGRIVRIDPVNGDVHTAAAASQGELATDPSGGHLAWLAAGDGSAHVVLRTVWDGAVALSDDQEFPARPRCCDNPFLLDGITENGQVIASSPAYGLAWVWSTPDGGLSNQVRAIDGLGEGRITQVAAAGVVVERPSFSYDVGVVDEGRFIRRATLSARIADFADPAGHRVVYADADDEIHVREIGPRRRRGSQDVRLQLPSITGGFDAARWEDADHVLLDVTDASVPHGALVRCAVDTGSCEVALRFDRAHLLAE